MRRTSIIVLTLILLLGSVGGCGIPEREALASSKSETQESYQEVAVTASPEIEEDEASTTEIPEKRQQLVIWSFTSEVKVLSLAFQKEHPEIDIEYIMIPLPNVETSFDFPNIQDVFGTDEAPDIFVMEDSFVGSYISSDILEDIDSLRPQAEEMGTFPSVMDVGTSDDGVLRALSYTCCPGVMYYRRSLAKEYFGTDDPKDIQRYFSNIEDFLESAEIIKESSNGSVFTIAGYQELINPILNSRDEPFVQDGFFTSEAWMNDLMDLSKTFVDNGYAYPTYQWQDGWFAGMNDSASDDQGNKNQVFSYFLPSWGLDWVLMMNDTNKSADGDVISSTAGDWAAIPGPFSYRWGGTWLGMIKGCKNPKAAVEFLEFTTLNETTLSNWATGVYSNEYLRAIDPSVDENLCQPAGEFVSSAKVVEKIMEEMGEGEHAQFLGGQNPYEVYYEVASRFPGYPVQSNDLEFWNLWKNALEDYITGGMSKEEALQALLARVAEIFPEIMVDEETFLEKFETQ